ncbi:cytochrome P450 CYP736A12-like [Neltuma alba]|uniref:cytochrome P450 CYP736A12-like n=1 Tax=Neltuma alba TaxID=207710 RepID=UPI0010A363B4|nr:cytochrome P450 CYP736A12-like [Prosopis alba]
MFPSTLAIPAILLLTLILVLSTNILFPKRHKDGQNQPQGPPPLPIIGNLHMLGKRPHRSLRSLAQKYGPIMSLKLGQVPAIVVSSPEAAVQFLKTHDTVFATRPKIRAADPFSKGANKGVVFAEYGPYWRHVRKLCTIHLLSASRVEMFAPLRKEEVGVTVKSLERAAAAREVVDISEMVGELIENIIYRMVLGRAKDDRFNLKGLIKEAMSLVGAFNLADYVPWLGVFDLQGLTRKLKRNNKALEDVLDKIVMEHENTSKGQNLQHHNDFIHILLSLMHQPVDLQDDQDHVIDKANIKAILSDMVGGATDTSIVVIEWALSELLRHPRVMKNLQNELQNVVGMTRMVEESDLAKLSYLDMVIKETLRLYPVAPLLVPRESMEDVTINGCYIRKKTRVIVNVWAIGRDPKVWSENAHMFHPERFVDSNIDVRGHDFQLLPFGSGRRGCPGMNLGMTSVKFVLAQLVHCFSWELPYGMSPSDLDMNEEFGLSIPRAKHLLAVPTYRLHT